MSKEDPVTDPAATDNQAQARMGRRSKVEPSKEKILDWIKGEPGIQSIAIVERLREEGFDGGKSAVHEFVRKHRPPKQPGGIVRFESLPGEFAQHDFGQIVGEYQDGTKERIHFFASQLRYSRAVRVRVVPDETVETICYSVFEAYDYFDDNISWLGADARLPLAAPAIDGEQLGGVCTELKESRVRPSLEIRRLVPVTRVPTAGSPRAKLATYWAHDDALAYVNDR